jgi:hypothetical protein
MSLAAANRDVWALLRDGVKVSVPDRERGGQKTVGMLRPRTPFGAVTEAMA